MANDGAGAPPAPVHLVQTLRGKACSVCGNELWYSEYPLRPEHRGHDASFCIVCDEWAEEACDDPACEACAGRPERPSGVPYPFGRLG